MSAVLWSTATEAPALNNIVSAHEGARKGVIIMGKSLVRQAVEKLGKDWSKGKLTRQKLLQNTKEFARFVSNRYGLERIENLKPAMVQAYIRERQECGLGSSTLAGKLTAVRVLASAIGKKNIVPKTNQEFGIARIRINPQDVDGTKLGEIRGALIERAAAGDSVAQMVVAADALRVAFGLRAKESLMTSVVVVRDGRECLKVEGAKGGRERFLPIDTESKAEAVRLAHETSKKFGSATGRIIPPQLTLKQAYDAQRNLWASLGGIRANACNMHGQRHMHAREMEAGGATRAEIMVDLGHGEERSPSAYLPK